MIKQLLLASLLLSTAACEPIPAVDKNGLASGTKMVLLNSNYTVCIEDVLYFVTYQGGVPVITTAVVDKLNKRSAMKCENGISLTEFGKIK